MRDDFTKKTRELLGNKVGWRCSNPNCRKLTRGAATGKKYADIGVAAHIKAASKGGKRYDDSMSPSERKDYDNGIWLCQNCAKLIDSNEEKYTVELLHSWKDKAEKASSRELEGGFFENAKMMTYHAVYSLKDDEVVGREKEKEDIISYINHGTRIFNVHGMPGIGKSTICYYALQEYAECEGYLLFEIGVRGCDLFQLFMAKMAETFGCDQKKNIETRLLQVISEYSKDNIVILYYDNFEDCLSDNETIKFLDRVIHLNCNIRIILSTRETIGGTDNYLISPMSLEVCYKLFERKVNAINSGLVMDKSMAMDFIENKLDKHTESIILVAANSDGFCSLDEMIKMWESERDYLLDENGKEISLTKSVGFSYNRIKGSNLMVAIWGCFPFFQYEISEEVIYELFSDCKNECKQALLKLVRKELIKRTDYGYQMLQPIRDRIYKLAPEYEFEVNERKIHNRVIDFYINKNRCTDYYGEAVYALRFAIKQINAVTNEEKTKKIIQLMYPLSLIHI